MVKRLNESEKENIVNGYNALVTMTWLAKHYGVTRQGIFKVLRRAEVDTSKRKITVRCACCDNKLERNKQKVRKQRSHFCDHDCYTAWLEAGKGSSGGKYNPSRWGLMVARKKIGEVFNIEDGMICHHEDRNCLNNELWNLRVFANQGDHIRHHRGFKIKPVWNGS